jgi:sugar phosphate isomerase/epimerase
MIRGGISSVSYRNSPPKTVIEMARGAGLGGIEWSADTHAPHGDFKRAEELMIATLRAGLTVTSYGSFFRLGVGDDSESSFALVLETARRLQAPAIRIWAPFDETASIDAITAEGCSFAEKTGKYGITLCIEPHERSAVADYRTLLAVAEKADHPFFRICWAQLPADSPEERRNAAVRLAPKLGLAHLRNWTTGYDRMPLENSTSCWTAVEGMAEHNRNSVLDRWAVIEYLSDERPETLKREAAALIDRIKAASG